MKSKFKIAFITAYMSGKTNKLRGRKPVLRKQFGGHNFFLFTNLKNNRTLNNSGWTIRYLSNNLLDEKCLINDNTDNKNCYRSRYIKWQAHHYFHDKKEHYDFIFYCDVNTNLDPNFDWVSVAQKYRSLFGIVQRKWIYNNKTHGSLEECDNIIQNGTKDKKSNVLALKHFLLSNNMPTNFLLTANNFFGFDPNNKKATDCFDYFFDIYSKEQLSYRDQPLWGFSRWKKGLIVDLFTEKYINNLYP